MRAGHTGIRQKTSQEAPQTDSFEQSSQAESLILTDTARGSLNED
jgi:hypothetical protein